MTREEWYTKYSAARMLIQARFRGGHYRTDSRQLVWDITYDAVDKMGDGILEAVFAGHSFTVDIRKFPSLMKHNTRAFARRDPIRESKMKWREYEY